MPPRLAFASAGEPTSSGTGIRINGDVVFRSVILNRISFGLALFILPFCVATYIYSCLAQDRNISFAMMFFIFPLILVIISTLMSVIVFTFNGSWIGANRRIGIPGEYVNGATIVTWARIRHFRVTFPLATWWIAESGLVLRVIILGMAVIPRTRILSVTITDEGTVIHHSSSEVRSPITTSCKVGEQWHSLLGHPR